MFLGVDHLRTAIIAVLLAPGFFGLPSPSFAQEQAHRDDIREFAISRIGEFGESTDWNGIYLIRISPDRKKIATRNRDQIVHVYDLATGKQLYELDGHEDRVLAIAFSSDSKLIATAAKGANEKVKIWDAESGELISEFDGGAIQLNFDVRTDALFVLGEKHVGSIDLENKSLAIQSKWDNSRYEALAMSSDSEKICRYFESSRPTSFQELTIDNLIDGTKTVVSGLAARPFTAEFSNTGQYLAVLYQKNSKVCLWNLSKPKEKFILTGHEETVQAVRFSQDERFLGTVGWDHKVVIWDVLTGQPIVEFAGHTEHVCAVEFSDDLKLLATGASGRTDCSVIVWNAFKGIFPEHSDRPVVIDDPSLMKQWDALWDNNPVTALRAVSLLSRDNETAMLFFERTINETTSVSSDASIRNLIEQLDSSIYLKRREAFDKLSAMRSVAENQLREALSNRNNSSEIRLAVGEILTQTPQQPTLKPSEYRQMLRLVHILELNGSSKAIELLRRLERGHSHIDVVRAATHALRRIGAQ